MEGSSPLLVTLTGACTALPHSKDVYSIVATVRTREPKSIVVANRSLVDWELKPVFEGAYFSGPDVLEVPAGSTANYEVTYYPLTMTSDTNKHLVDSVQFLTVLTSRLQFLKLFNCFFDWINQ